MNTAPPNIPEIKEQSRVSSLCYAKNVKEISLTKHNKAEVIAMLLLCFLQERKWSNTPISFTSL
jgi:hypothetical protein